MARLETQLLHPPVQQLAAEEFSFRGAGDLVNPPELFELLARLAKDAQNAAIEREPVDPPGVAILSGCVDETSCLILDIAMPVMSGPELQRELKRRGQEIPIIFITGQSQNIGCDKWNTTRGHLSSLGGKMLGISALQFNSHAGRERSGERSPFTGEQTPSKNMFSMRTWSWKYSR